MTDQQEPEHVFRVESCGETIRFIAADCMVVDKEGVVRLLLNRQGEEVLDSLVAVIYPHTGLIVTRVDCLLATEGLAQS